MKVFFHFLLPFCYRWPCSSCYRCYHAEARCSTTPSTNNHRYENRPLTSTSPPGCNCPWRVEGSTTSKENLADVRCHEPRTKRPKRLSEEASRLIYSSQGLGAATQSNAGAVSHDSHIVGAVNRGGSPTSDKSSGPLTIIVPQPPAQCQTVSALLRSIHHTTFPAVPARTACK